MDKENSDYSELIDYLDIKFQKIDVRFEKIDEKFERIDERFERIDERFERIDERFNENEISIRNLQNSVDKLAHQVLSFQQEMTIMTMKVARMENWIQQVATKVGVEYKV